MPRKIPKTLSIILGLIVSGIFFGSTTASATTLDIFGATDLVPGQLKEPYSSVFPQNNLTGWNPLECVAKGTTSGSCFKIDSSIDAQDFWYAEGCLSKCKSSSYAHTAYDSENPFLRNDTESDEGLGGMLYIYADNYDIDYDAGWIAKFSPNGGNSTQKYYWVVLPSEAYSTGFGETYVATFENLSEPIYFITFDTHACEHQSEDYCGQAATNPDGVAAGKEFLGAITDTGSPTAAADILGKLTSLCRIKGRGEVTASHNESAINTATSGSASSASSTSSTANKTSGSTVAEKIWNWFIDANISGISDNPAAIAGIIGAFSTEAGGNTIDGLTPFSWSSWGGTLLGCIPSYCGDIKNKVTEAVGQDYFAYKTGVDGIPEEAVDKAIDLELKFMMNDYNSGINWRTFVENLDVVSNKTPESYAELFEVIVQNAADPSGDAVQDEGIINWVANHSGYSTVQQVLSKKRELAREVYERFADICNPSGGNNTIVDKTLELAWSDNDHWREAKPEYIKAKEKLGDIDMEALDCGKFVSTVIRAAGVDPDYPLQYTETLMNHMASSSLWEEINNNGNEDNLEPGDVFVNHQAGTSNGHIFIYLGDGMIAQANLNTFSGKATELDRVYFSDSRGQYRIFRAKNNTNNDNCNFCPTSENEEIGSIYDGLDDEQITKLIANYKNDVDNWSGRVAQPGNYCIGDASCVCATRFSNCTLFSAFFVEMFTNVGFGNGWGNGGNIVNQLSGMGFKTGTEPKAFSVFSCGSTSWGHTGVVVRVDGGTVITAEAGYCKNPGSRVDNTGNTCVIGETMTYAYLDDRLDYQKLMDFINK
ncbi:hypothetical protein IJH01_03315 [Candidatus Saccharibacteria bacterium]|nr:hypothetical protein [Candidatus Saccharibacteria bacterium]